MHNCRRLTVEDHLADEVKEDLMKIFTIVKGVAMQDSRV